MGSGCIDFQGLWGGGALLRRFFHEPLFPRPSSGEPQPVEEGGLGVLHSLGGVGVAEGAGDAGQCGEFESGTQILGWLLEPQEGFERGLIPFVAVADADLGVDLGVGLGAGPVEVEIGVEVLSVEALDGLGVGGLDVAEADVLADDSSVIGLDQAAVGVEASDSEGELAQHDFEYGQHVNLADGGVCGHDLPLRDLFDGVDMVDALGSGAASGCSSAAARDTFGACAGCTGGRP